MTDAQWALIAPLMPPPKTNWSASHDMFTRRIRRDPVHCNDRMPITARQWFAPQTMSIRIGQAGYSPHFR
jgi:hypothetical protein